MKTEEQVFFELFYTYLNFIDGIIISAFCCTLLNYARLEAACNY